VFPKFKLQTKFTQKVKLERFVLEFKSEFEFRFGPFPFRPLSGIMENADYAGFLHANFRARERTII
jgi:hypothetical protein